MVNYSYDTIIFLKILEMLAYLILFSSVFRKFKSFEKFTKGAIFIMIAAILGVFKSFLFVQIQLLWVEISFSILIIFLISFGVLDFSKKQ